MIVVSEKVKKLMEELKKNNPETYYHCLRVKKFVNRIIHLMISEGTAFFTPIEVNYICKGALLHDIGKLYIKNVILTKEDKLSEDEFSEIRKHTVLGYEAIKDELSLEETEIVRNICLCHHERVDGGGYNKSTDIPIYVQVVAVSDVFEALTSDRPYHVEVSAQKAVEMIENGECGQFTPQILSYLRKAVCDFNAF